MARLFKGRKMDYELAIIGAGPAGLTAASELLKINNFRVEVLDQNYVIGGLARTTKYKGCKFDIGPHRFISRSDKIIKFWKKLMEGERENNFVQLSRFTRIYYNKYYMTNI